MKAQFLAAFLIAVPLLAACRDDAPAGEEPSPLVKEILASEGSEARLILNGYRKAPSSGDIYIIGTAEGCAPISNAFLECDVFDNVRGLPRPDALKDFAGENFCTVEDRLYAPYDSLAANELRDAVVRMALASLDTHCSAGVYDVDGRLEKSAAKILVLADPHYYLYGQFDVDTLFSRTACAVKTVSPQALLMEAAFGGEKKSFNIGILCDSLYARSGLYTSIFRKGAESYGIVGASCFESPVRGHDRALFDLLDAYSASGRNVPLDAILIDDYRLSAAEVRAQMEVLRDYSREESMQYNNQLAPGCRLFHSSDLTMQRCYETMRGMNLFTHRIAMPSASAFVITAMPGSEGDEGCLLIPGALFQNDTDVQD